MKKKFICSFICSLDFIVGDIYMHNSHFRENVNVLSFLGGQFCDHSTSSLGHRQQAGLMRGTANDCRWFILIFKGNTPDGKCVGHRWQSPSVKSSPGVNIGSVVDLPSMIWIQTAHGCSPSLAGGVQALSHKSSCCVTWAWLPSSFRSSWCPLSS